MKEKSTKDLETLSLFTHYCGMLSVFLGLTVTFMAIVNNDLRYIQVGIYVFITGYAFAKISKKISQILYDEKVY